MTPLASFFAPRIPLKPLLGLCRRMGITLDAGIDVRTALAREAERAGGPLHRHLAGISQAVNQGRSLEEAFAATGDYFPSLMREMIAMGEQSGHLDAILTRLADHYENQLRLRRSFWSTITWPLTQLGLAVFIVGFLIWIMGFLGGPAGSKIDILGFGLMGNSGLAVYAAFVASAVALVCIIVRAIGRGLLWTRPIQRMVLQIPGIGGPFRTLALARLAWSMHITFDAGMELHKALKLSLQATQNARFTDQIPLIDAEITAGNSIHHAFVRAGGYPIDFLDALQVGEQSGKLVESMAHLARQYQEQARAALAALTVLAGWCVWIGCALLIIFMIFRIFSFYLAAISG